MLLVEAGGPDADPNVHAAAHFRRLWGGELDWKYTTERERGLHGRRVRWPRGRVLGGSSSINGMLYVRGHRRDFDRWAALGNDGWGYDDVLPYFKKSENYDRGASRYHGSGGPLNVKQKVASESAPVEIAFTEAGVEHGFGGPDWDFNGERQDEGCGFHQITVNPDGTRASAATAFLHPVHGRRNLSVVTSGHVTRLLVENRCVTGIEYLQDGGVQRVHVEREVVLCAGAVDSPKLLMLSGIGPPEVLRQHAIRVVADLPGVGRNLQDHLIVGVAFRARQPLPAWGDKIVGEAGLFTRTQYDSGTAGPDLQLHFFRDLHLGPRELIANLDAPGFAFVPTLLKPESLGRISLSSSDPQDAARIHARYLASDRDVKVMAAGIRLSRELARMPAFDSLRGDELAPGMGSTTERELQEYVTRYADTVFHPVGTCKMGNDDHAVVDAQLRVHGLIGLRVADASIMPEIIAANTNAACIMIGEKAADLVRDRVSV